VLGFGQFRTLMVAKRIIRFDFKRTVIAPSVLVTDDD
jgi:hypothetical protein